ncbi:putative RNA polymerase I-specific transcription initiation factor Rrn7 [Talaromyces proteolyticus]|uniref:RNA polymerase I-specific transcription initiation factor Rrn7 n=1 Tax=Talaromyces proteolyticus TaxID=1131652 RepID=A0AAD4KUY2_9EURO|nr:putative RNA polymerase I-specific transcription initiation factor Rrn7 [Talaromyces proteolyticus]KAH8700456.1 putative RNA polymerase I-specific transcription initiation factor Rrn7 [Talaromyces proteolyticus]
MEYVKRGPCGQDGCRETRYYLEDGVWFCRRGHQQEGRQVEADPDDFGKRGTIHRVKKISEERIQKTFTGRRGYRLFVQAYQLILWTQCHALIHEKGFPTDLERVVRDLWALRLQSLTAKFDESLDADKDASSEVFSSQLPGAETPKENGSASHKLSDNPLLEETLGLCYLAASLLRLPVSIGDIYRFAMRNEIPFIQAIRTVPLEIRDRLSQIYIRELTVETLPRSDHLHKTVSRLVVMYSRECSITFPPLNVPLMLFQFVRQLALPLEVYSYVRRLQKLLNYTFQFPLDKKYSTQALSYPEAQILALIVVSTKLLFPFSKTKGYPSSAAEPTAQILDWDVWSSAQRHFEKKSQPKERLAKGQEVTVNDGHVFHFTDQQLDDYLDWYEDTWIDKNRPTNPLAEMFPISRPESAHDEKRRDIDQEAIDEKVRAVTSSLRPAEIIPFETLQANDEESQQRDPDIQNEDTTPRPGFSYRVYKTESDMPKVARKFHETAANLSGLTVKTLIKAVRSTELKLEKWQANMRRAEYHGETWFDNVDFQDQKTDESGSDSE